MSSIQVSATKRFSVMSIGEASSQLAQKEKVNKAENIAKDKKETSKKEQSNNGDTKKQQSKKSKGSKNNNKKTADPPREWTEDMQSDLDRILSVGEECISEGELKSLITAKGRESTQENGINLYDGFEPSGRMHIAQGVFKAMNVNKCTFEGTNSTFIFWVADWFALMNDKMGGDLKKIKIVGEYLIEVWKAAGMNLDHVIFKWASDEITNKADIYWPKMLDVARRFNITRIKKCCQIMGRLEGSLTSAQVLYPLMQCTDVFFLKADICQLGVDQRKVNMLAREYCDAAGIKRKPVILSHHMLYGLKAGQEKMSKSDPDSAVFMEDSAEDVERKIMAAYCPSKEESGTGEGEQKSDDDAGKESMHLKEDNIKNPCLDYIENIILSPPGATFSANGTSYSDFPSIKTAFLNGQITEDQLKKGLIDELNKLLQPVRDHFSTDSNAKGLLEQVRQFKREGNSKAGAESECRRLNLVSTEKVPSGCHAVFAPLPSTNPSLQQAFETTTLIKKAKPGTPTVLFLPDWTARVCNICDADIKAIDAFYTIFVASIQALDPDAMKDVVVVKQSEAILVDPSNYWISVINIGRHFMLDDVMGSNLKDSDGVGYVIGRLMMVADVMGIEPSSISFCESESSTIEMGLIRRYYDEVLLKAKLSSVDLIKTEIDNLTLQEKEEAHKTDNDEYYLLDDPKVHGKSKMKKAFCEPGNIGYCPPIILSTTFGPKEIVIKRSPENGGDVTFSAREEMEAAFKDGSLHPGDLKATATAIMVKVLETLSGALKSNSDATKASKALKAFAKKMAKKKK